MIKKHSQKWDLLGSDTRYFIITGGRGSGKSFEVNRFATILTFEQNQTILFTRKTLTSAHISIIPEFKEKIEFLNLESKFEVRQTEIVNISTKSEIIFRGLQSSSKDNTANLKSLHGITCWILDEAEELTDEATFDKIDLSVREKATDNRVILILNPTTKEHWIYKRFFESAGVEPGYSGIKNGVTYIHTDYTDNIENLSPSFLQQVENIKQNNPDKYRHTILGGWLDKAEGVVYSNWKVGEFQEASIPIYGQDFGFSIDPTTLIKVCIDKSAKLLYVKECFYKTGLVSSEIAGLNKSFAGKSLIYADSAEPRLIEEMQRQGLNIKPTEKGIGSITAGISIMQDYQIIVDPNSINIVRELNNYVWNDKKSGTPIDAFNHALDAIRYVILPTHKPKRVFADASY